MISHVVVLFLGSGAEAVREAKASFPLVERFVFRDVDTVADVCCRMDRQTSPIKHDVDFASAYC